MIFSSIYSKDDTTIYPKAIQRAIEYLKTNDFASMEPGVYEIQGKEMYAQVFDVQTEPAENKKPEVHEKYIDVQFLVSGRERLGITPDTGSYEVDQRLDERDLIFYKKVENEGFIEARPGCFCIFFPGDVHRPAVMSGKSITVRKVVVKVKLTLLYI
jgi:YhcH/YjgK/YiaL family protein